MKWEEVCENKLLQDLPFKIELNKWGQIIMSPVKIKHSFHQGRIQRLLESLLNSGEVMPECAIDTSDGVKVTDVVWYSEERFDKIQDEVSASIAAEICILPSHQIISVAARSAATLIIWWEGSRS